MSAPNYQNANFAISTLAGTLTSADTTGTLALGTGGLFPALSAGEVFAGILTPVTGNNYEIVYVTAISGDVITMERGQESSTAQTWTVGSNFINGITAAQIAAALSSGLQSGITVLTSSGTYTVPANVTAIKVTVIGGGGGASGCSSSVYAGACGGGGGWAQSILAVTGGENIAYTVGGSGAGGPAGSTAGGGGTSSFSSGAISATGGAGGGGSGGTLGGAGGFGGEGTAGTLIGYGGDGSDGSAVIPAALAGWPGLSGGSYFGGSVRSINNNTPGRNGFAYGAGGSAAYSVSGGSDNGGSGAAGAIIVELL